MGTDDLGPVNSSIATAADGNYQFRNLRPGSYSITETEPASYLHGKNALGSLGGTLAGDQVIGLSLNTGAAGNHYDFAELVPASLAGFVFQDANNNGSKDPGEAGIANVTVALAGTDDKGPVNLTTVTAGDGSYQFRNLRPGSYTITETEPAGYIHGKNTLGAPGGTILGNLVFAVNVGVGVGGGADPVVHSLVFGALVPLSVSAGDVGRRSRRRDGVPDVRHGPLRHRRLDIHLRHHRS